MALSVPFSSGQWLLLRNQTMGRRNRGFQSPFHRGNGCYFRVQREAGAGKLSVPFSSGQWLLHPLLPGPQPSRCAFSPLFIGAMVATETSTFSAISLSVFQSPFHRGNGCYSTSLIAARPS